MKKTTAAEAKKSRTVPVSEMVESIVGDKWSLSVLTAVRSGIHHPDDLERACPGISTKVLNERLRKMESFGILEREEVGRTSPRVEYRLTALGGRFVRLIDDVHELQRAVDTGTVELRGSARKARPKTG
ncbi:MAG TPA: winged helix-turn-helix transcriptional regulator [Candidatus Krumholzibacteria bacterium]